jgi:glucan phosphoethanolaminetransferase (alkaline phosphatase superfamily)
LEKPIPKLKFIFDPEFKPVRNKFEFWYRLFQNLLLPRSFYLLLLPLFSVLVYLLEQLNLNVLPGSTFWLGMTIIYWLSLIISIPSSYLNARTAIALIHLPAVLMSMVSAAAKAKVGNNTFIPTEKVYDKFD